MRRNRRRTPPPMNLEIVNPDVLTMGQAAEFVANTTGVKPHVNTMMRWVIRGVGGQRLPATRVGRLWVTRRQNIVEFLEQCNATHGRTADSSEVIRKARAAESSRRHCRLAADLGLD